VNNPQQTPKSHTGSSLRTRGQWIQIPVNIILVFCLVAGSLYMQIAAHRQVVNLGWFIGVCALFSVASVLFYTWEHSGAVELMIAVSVGVVFIIGFKVFSASVIAYFDNLRQRFGLFNPGYAQKPDRDATLCFLLFALIASLLAASYLMRSGSILLGTGIPALSFLLATVRFREKCSPVVIVGVLCAMVIILLTHRVRNIDEKTAARQSLIISVPVVVLLVALTLLIHPGSYTFPDWGKQVKEQTNGMITKIFGEIEKEEYFGSTQLYRAKFDLNDLGPRPNDRRKVMEVRADEQTNLYLRGFSYIGYRGGTWVNETPEQASAFNGVLENPLTVPKNSRRGNAIGTVNIRTNRKNDMIFMPYTAAEIPEGGFCYGDSYVNNKEKIVEYSMSYGRLSAVNTEKNSEYERLVFEHYLEIPKDTAEGLRTLAVEQGIVTAEEAEAGRPQNVTAAVERVTELVSSCARYDTDAPRVPEGKDFALWFITEAGSGYCSHFASAETLMLRAIGVPARFTSGFVVHTVPGKWVKVIGDNAHAWVEYYDAETGGWVVEDPTPGALPAVSAGDVLAAQPSGTDAILSSADIVTVPSSADIVTMPTLPDIATESSGSDTAIIAPQEPPVTIVYDGVYSEPLPPSGQTTVREAVPSDWTIVLYIVVLLPLPVCALLYYMRKRAVAERERTFAEGSNRERIIAMSEYLELLRNARGGSWSAQVRDILLEAQFSTHDMTDVQLRQVQESVEQSIEAVKVNSGVIGNLINKYIRFMY